MGRAKRVRLSAQGSGNDGPRCRTDLVVPSNDNRHNKGEYEMKLCLFNLPIALLLCLVASLGCNRSNDAAVAQVKSEAETAKAELAQVDADLAKLRSPQSSKETVADVPKVDAGRRAAEWVLRVDGSIRVVVDGVPHEVKKGEKLPEGSVTLLAVNLNGCPKATDEGREYLRGLKGLQELYINDGTGIRNLDFLADMTGLQTLISEGGTPLVSDADLVHIKEMKRLKTLVIVNQWGNHPNENLTGKVFGPVKELKQLENLRLCNCKLKGDGIRQLEGHPALRTLDFWLSKIEDPQLASLATLPKLESLGLVGTPITDAGLVHLKGMSSLKHLDLRYTKVTDAGAAVLKKSLPNCQFVTK
jgi:hypothetical protein